MAYQQAQGNDNQNYEVMPVPLTVVDVLSPVIQIRRPLRRRLLRQSNRALSQLAIAPYYY